MKEENNMDELKKLLKDTGATWEFPGAKDVVIVLGEKTVYIRDKANQENGYIIKLQDIDSIRVVNARSDAIKMVDTERWSLLHTHKIELNRKNNEIIIAKSKANERAKEAVNLEGQLEESQNLLLEKQAREVNAFETIPIVSEDGKYHYVVLKIRDSSL